MAKAHRRKLKLIGRSAAISAEERLRQILDERTERLAARTGHGIDASAPADQRRVLVCTVGRERFGIPVEAVSEVLPYRACAPGSIEAAALVGHFGRAGQMVSVIDLGRALGLSGTASEDGGHFVLLRRDHPHIALRIDRAEAVTSVLPIGSEGISGLRSDAIVGLVRATTNSSEPQQDAIALLDIDRLLRPFLSPSPAFGA